MHTLLIGRGPELASGGKLISDKNLQEVQKADSESTKSQVPSSLRVVDLFLLLCNLLEVESVPVNASQSGDMNRVKQLLRYPSDTQVVKVIRNWMTVALMPENVPITSTIKEFSSKIKSNQFFPFIYI